VFYEGTVTTEGGAVPSACPVPRSGVGGP